MIERRILWLALGFAAGLFLTGIPFWRLPYNANFFADPFVLAGFVALGLVTALLAASGVARLSEVFWIMMAAFPLAVMIRVAIETSKDPTDHNLWPFELVFAAIVSVLAVGPALGLGALLRRFKA